jgi:putative ABC transport system permease protein
VLQREIMGGPQGNVTASIVGVVGDAQEEGPTVDYRPMIYACGYLRYWPNSDFLIQSRSPAALATIVRPALHRIEPSRPVYAVRTLADALDGSLATARFRTLLVTVFSALALLLAAIGLYGVMAYMVSQRTREIGVRIALGARRGQIVGEILRSGGGLAAAGATVGVVLAAASSRMLGSLLFGIQASDLATYATATGVLLGAALLACLIPTRRATAIDPTSALRE